MYDRTGDSDTRQTIALIEGIERFKGATVVATDLRAGAALVCAALAADGTSFITQARKIDRGYENIVQKLKSLGADIERTESPEYEPDAEA